MAETMAFAHAAGMPCDYNLVVAGAVARAESSLYTCATNYNSGGSVDRGLWQINVRAHPEFDPIRLFEQDYNARAAFLVSSHGTNWNPWTTFKNGAYRKYLPAGSNA